ncbi:MAG TPA: CBS domain-containing protein [Acidimicrobiales bacterium]|nr:CBS domain-containing protein [Acidimicrobiales bacterium]
MAESIRTFMSAHPITVDSSAPVVEAARAMRDSDIGPVLVMDGGQLCGIVTDRDITIRVVADGGDPSTVKVGDICSKDPTTLSPDDSVEDAVRLMKDRAVRRLPVVEGGKPVGIVSLGDLAGERELDPTLDAISSAPPDQ